MAEANITLVGNLTRDPEIKFLNTGTPAVKFGLAVTKKWRDRNGADQEQTSFFDCSALGPIATNIADSLHKGNRVVVTGTLEQRSYDDKEGNKRSAVEVKVEACGPDLRFNTASVSQGLSQPAKPRYSEPEDAF